MRGEDNEMTTVRALLFALQTVPEGDGPLRRIKYTFVRIAAMFAMR